MVVVLEAVYVVGRQISHHYIPGEWNAKDVFEANTDRRVSVFPHCGSHDASGSARQEKVALLRVEWLVW